MCRMISERGKHWFLNLHQKSLDVISFFFFFAFIVFVNISERATLNEGQTGGKAARKSRRNFCMPKQKLISSALCATFSSKFGNMQQKKKKGSSIRNLMISQWTRTEKSHICSSVSKCFSHKFSSFSCQLFAPSFVINLRVLGSDE